MALFGKKSSSKSSLLEVDNISNPSKGDFAIFIPDLVIDHSVTQMGLMLVGKFAGARPNIDYVHHFIRGRWFLKG